MSDEGGAAPATGRTAGLARFVPGLAVARTYRRGWLSHDLVAGLVVTALLVPQGMAYAELAGLPPVTGLYTTVMALLAYAVFGPSRVLILGPDSSLGPMIAASILPLVGADGDPAKAVALASILALFMGAICVVAGLAKLGKVAELLSKPVRVGYLNGLAVVVFVSQLPKLFGFSTDGDTFFSEVKAFVDGVTGGSIVGISLAIGLACLVVIVGLKKVAPKVPGVLVAVVGATVAVGVLGLEADGVSVVGSIPGGFPVPSLPHVDVGDLAGLFVAALGLAFVTLADASALSRSFALKHGDHVDPNQEILALGTSNLAAGLFQGFPVSASSSRTAVADDAGGRSQLVGVVGAVAIVVLLVFANDLVADLPNAALAAIVIAASFGLLDLATTRWLWRVRRTEFALLVTAMAGVVLVGVLQGIVVAVVLSLAAFIWRAWHPHAVELAVVPGRSGLHDLDRHADGRLVAGVAVFQFDGPIFFANAEVFVTAVRALAASRDDVATVIIAAEPITDIDTTGAEGLQELVDDLRSRDVTLVFAELGGRVRDLLDGYGLVEAIGREHFVDRLEDAVATYRTA